MHLWRAPTRANLMNNVINTMVQVTVTNIARTVRAPFAKMETKIRCSAGAANPRGRERLRVIMPWNGGRSAVARSMSILCSVMAPRPAKLTCLVSCHAKHKWRAPAIAYGIRTLRAKPQ